MSKKVDPRRMNYDPVKGEKIAGLIISGWTIKKICALDDMPGADVFFRWLREHEDFAEIYARAKEDQADMFVDEMLMIADDDEPPQDGVVEPQDGVMKIDYNKIQRDKLRIDVRKWAASKFKAKKYGDRTILAGDADAPLVQPDKLNAAEQAALNRYIETRKQTKGEVVKDVKRNSDADYSDLV